MKLIIVSGLSGSGKSVALHALEDMGYYCIDNLPIGLLPSLSEQIITQSPDKRRLFAVGIDARNLTQDFANFPSILKELQLTDFLCEVLYLQAEDSELIKRFSETRRKHPLTNNAIPLKEALKEERRILDPVISCADMIIDTTHTNIHQLRDLLVNRLSGKTERKLSVQFLSFGFKHGIPTDADFVFDVRCLPNPHWVPELRNQTGRDEGVHHFLSKHDSVDKMLEDIIKFLSNWLPCFEADNRTYVTIAIGCTGGQHRSVYFVEKLSSHFSALLDNVTTRHRELT